MLLTLVLFGYKFEVPMIEQRRNQRFDMRLPVKLLRLGANPRPAGETKNVSSSGVLFTSPTHVDVGDPIEYEITFPRTPGSRSEVRLHCVGKVMREDPESAFAATMERYEFIRQSA